MSTFVASTASNCVSRMSTAFSKLAMALSLLPSLRQRGQWEELEGSMHKMLELRTWLFGTFEF